jgi:hypothetical protein
MATAVSRLCIYCGDEVRNVRRGEHLFPEAIGGTKTTKDVCGSCNNAFSDIDGELCSRSPLSIVAAKEIDGHLAQAWDTDSHDNRLLLIGRPDFTRESFKIYPQLILQPSGDQFRANYDELLPFGVEKFQVLFSRRLRKAFWEHEYGDGGAFYFAKVTENPELFSRHCYPPRFFVRGSIAEACGDKTIEIGYIRADDKRYALSRLESGLEFTSSMRTSVALGSALPTIRVYCHGGKVWRALAKIATNLLHHCCSKTIVDCHSFPEVISEIRGTQSFPASRLDFNGFVCASDIESMKSDPRSHMFRLSWKDNVWRSVFAFFGGRIGAVVSFPGPSREDWKTLDILAPIGSSDWRITPTALTIPMRFNIEWSDLTRLIPDGGFMERAER